MLKKDPKLPFLDMAWSPSRMEEFFNRSVLPMVYPGQQVTAVAIDGMTYTPGRACVILYSLQFDGQPDNPPRWAVVTFAKDNRLQEVYTRHYSRNLELSGISALGSTVLIAEYQCLVEFFPMDWKLPFLVRVMES